MLLTLAELSVAAALLSGVAALLTHSLPALMRFLVFPLLGISGLLALASGIGTLLEPGTFTTQLPLGLPWLHWQIRLDPLSALFLSIIGLMVTAASIYGPSYVREFEHRKDPLPVLGGFTGLFVAGMLMVVLSNDVYMFMISWEIMALSTYFLVTFQHENSANRRSGFFYLLMAHIGASMILLAYAVLAGFGDGFTFDTLRAAELTQTWATVAFLLAFAGFGLKAGLVPLHAWLPEAHPVAPSHVSALMSAVMLKVAIYGFIRFTYDLLGFDYITRDWGVLVLILGSATALIGVLYALVQRDVSRVLAYSSVENIGVIFIGLGLSLVFFATGHEQLGALGLIAALFHAVNHSIFKGLLFFGAGAIAYTARERSLDQLGGLLKKMPWTGFFMLIGSLSIASLPPFNGFVSEWLILQAALQEWAMEGGMIRFIIPSSAAVLALTGALALACFVRLYGVAFLGQARSRRARRASEVPFSMRLAQAFLAVLCVLFGLLATQILQVIQVVPDFLSGQPLQSLSSHGSMWLTPIEKPDTDSISTASYSAPLVVLSIGGAWWVVSLMVRRGKVKTIRPCEPWDGGFSKPDARMQYTAAAFAQPFQRVFSEVFKINEEVERDRDGLKYRVKITDRNLLLFYQPIAQGIQLAAKKVALLQSGSIRNYLAWSLGTLVVLLWIIS